MVVDKSDKINIYSTKPPVYLKEYEREVSLKDNCRVLLRPLTYCDFKKLVHFFYSLSKETLYYRYFSVNRNCVEQELNRLVKALDQDEIILVAEFRAFKQKQIIAISELVTQGNDRTLAECAIIVTDLWQGKTLGSQMLEWTVHIAKEKGINCIIGWYSLQNRRVSTLIQKSGYYYKANRSVDIVFFNLFLDRHLGEKNGNDD